MEKLELIRNCIICIAGINNILIFIKIYFEKSKLKKDENYKIKNNSLILLITINIILFIIYGISRNI